MASGLAAEYAGDCVLALAFGIVFQYFAIAPMRGPHPLMPGSAAFWFLMQVGMMAGYATSRRRSAIRSSRVPNNGI